MKVKRLGITELMRRIWLFSANKIESTELVKNQHNSSLWHTIVTLVLPDRILFPADLGLVLA